MRVLFYGGCHALVLHKVFQKFTDKDVASDYLINFHLIDRQERFPYETLGNYDAIVFSPIINQGQWNTTNLLKECVNIRLRTIVFPWLQWNGYFPGARKDETSGRNGGWKYDSLLTASDKHTTFDTYYQSILDGHIDKTDINEHQEICSKVLETKEIDAGADIRVSKFISDNYARKRLFLTPDHPTTALYKFVVREISQLLDINIDRSFYLSGNELQAGLRLPILPHVKSALKLGFCDLDYEDRSKFPGIFSSRDYAKINYYSARERILLRATYKTRGKLAATMSSMQSEAYLEPFERNDMVAGTLLAEQDGHYIINADEKWIASEGRFIELGRQLFFYQEHWEIEGPRQHPI